MNDDDEEVIKKLYFPYNRLDDLLLFGVWALLACAAWIAKDKALASNLASGWMGAVGMYMKGQGQGGRV